jgi:hypothetical protein
MAEQAERARHGHFVGLLTFASGGVDVVTLMMIGGAFTSVITGNLIFVGRAVGTTSLTPAVHAILAVAGYILGVAAGSRLRLWFGRDRPGRGRSILNTGPLNTGPLSTGPAVAAVGDAGARRRMHAARGAQRRVDRVRHSSARRRYRRHAHRRRARARHAGRGRPRHRG